ncbi:hypothetical protein [Paludibacterium paludis]|uniref:Uncharacterized protein n=1 Tax=Paludibacterium paludis TaxID=1225769 RepID=A0A918P1H8_9NEIS|nr:hypothetical protein [Paludibacterium paludis]GGY13212.1 hypothetical protein GCM10011289_15570 [Paludibacterium paludis]
MASKAPFLICPHCCSTDIDAPAAPGESDILVCRHCGYQVSYGVMRSQVRRALEGALGMIREQVAHKVPQLFQ